MKKLIAITFSIFAAAASAAVLQLAPGLTAPGVADGARLEAAALLSTNATATATVAAVYELPVYGEVESVSTNSYAHYTLATNTVIGTNATLAVTDIYTVSTNPTYQVTDLYTVATNAGIVATNYLYIATNYFTVWTNTYPVMVNTPTVEVVTNRLLDVTDTIAITNELVSLTAEGGYAETNRVERWIWPGARLLVEGEGVTLIFR